MLAACMAVRPVLASHPLMLVCRQVQHAGCMTWPTRVRCSCESLVRPYRAGCRGQGPPAPGCWLPGVVWQNGSPTFRQLLLHRRLTFVP